MNSLLLVLFLLVQDPDAKKSAQQLFTEGQRFETVDKNYDKAISKYTKAVEKGKADSSKTLVAHALHNLARCHETMEPENIASAQEAWKQITSDYSDIEPYGAIAKNKVDWKGVDVYLKQFKTACDRWRDNRREQAALTAAREAAWGKITGISPDTDAIPGLLAGLAYDDEVVRAFAADCLAYVANGIDAIIAALNDPNPIVRGGAALALERVFQIWQEAAEFDQKAASIITEFNIQKLGASDIDDIDEELRNANTALENAKAAKSEAEKRTGDPDLVKSEIRLAELRVKQAEDHVKMLQNVKSTHARAADLTEKAKKVRHNIPERLATPDAQKALAALISDEGADPTARLEATKALLQIGDVSGVLTAALISGLQSKNKNVRIGCARACAGVSTEKSEDKHKLAAKLMELVQYEPEKQDAPAEPTPDEEAAIREALAKIAASSEEEAPAAIQAAIDLGDKVEPFALKASGQASGKMRARYDFVISVLQERRNANDPLVRQACAQALGKIGLVKSIPALIEALEDNNEAVRREANEALVAFTGQNFGYESDPPVRDPERKKSEAEKRAEQVKIRMEGVAKWKAWWDQTTGVPVLIDRFWHFQSRWTTFNAADLFDKDFFFRKAVQLPENASTTMRDGAQQRAQRVYDAFQKEKNVFVMDAKDLGPEALDRLMDRLDGKSDLERVYEKLGQQQRESLIAKSRAATRLFLAEAIAELAKAGGEGAVASKLVLLLGGDRGAGAAAALGLLSKDGAGSEARSGLESSGGVGSADPAVQEASANALMKIGDAGSSARPLTDVATSAKSEANPDTAKVRAAVAALRAIGALKCDNADTVKALGELIAHEPDLEGASNKALCDLVREWACEALGSIGNVAALPDLARARRDSKRNVQAAASGAIRKISASRQSEAVRMLFDIVKNEKLKSLDRIGAALAIGDVKHDPSVHLLVWRVLDKNAPRELRDSDPAVRAAVCRALGAIKNNTQFTIEKLLEAMADPAEEVRQEAYYALRETVGAKVAEEIKISVVEGQGRNPEMQEFKGWYTEKDRKEFLKKWKQWYEGQKGSLPKEPNREM